MKAKAEKQYLKELSRELGKKTDTKRAFIADVSADISEYISCHNNSDIKTLYDEFGTPAESALRFTDAKDYSKLKKNVRNYLMLKIISCVMLTIIVVLIAHFARLIKNSKDSYIVVDNNFLTSSSEVQ